jgi:dolichol-phosphate mannosyltransferase
MVKKKSVTFIIPAYNEEQIAKSLVKTLKDFFSKNKKYDFDAIIVENGSEDKTLEVLTKECAGDKRLKILSLSRNFRADGGFLAGLSSIDSDAAILMYADLEDPIEVTTEFLEKWEEGYDQVYGIVKKRQTGWLRSFNSSLFYYFLGKLTNNLIPKYVADYRLIDKKVYKALLDMDERAIFLRGMLAWCGFKSTGVTFDRTKRQAGLSKAKTLTVLSLAKKGIMSFSNFPLQFSVYLGLIISVFSFSFFVYFLIRSMFYNIPFTGYGSLMCSLWFLFGMLFFLLGIFGEYLGMVFDETKKRPRFIIKDRINFD